MSSVAASAAAHGFEVERAEDLAEIGGRAFVLRHGRSGARLLYLANDDPNKAFSISFKTPAADDTGVFHILEHSVLCGSRRFPVKEPFVTLLKTSMQTFLNAMTFPDKTMYPVASTNERDLMNLMEVYLDAVFQPAIYDRRTVFEQEGWHLELAPDGGVAYNGVVYNEMKGALSDPDSVLYDALSAALFPDTTYRFESGGTPEAIPELSYESYLDSHRRHYRPDNSYLLLYGDLDPERFLRFLDEEYLGPLADWDWPPLEANPLSLQPAVIADGVVRPMPTAPENASAALGFVIGSAADRERVVAADVLLDAIAGSNEAPLKRALLDAGLAADATAFVADSVAQPFALLMLRGVEAGPDSLQAFRQVVADEVRRLAEGGLDHDLVAAALSHAEFVLRERDFGYPDGVAYAMASLAGWLYDDDLACAYLRYEDVLASLRAKLGQGYFEQLLREVLLENDHRASVRLEPVGEAPDAAERARLAQLAASLDDGQRAAIAEGERALRQAQEAADAPADLARLPRLGLGDLGQAPEEAPFRLEEREGAPLLRHSVDTHGLVYATRFFDAGCARFDELPCLGVLALALGRLGTSRHSAAELDQLVQAHLGSLTFSVEVHEDALGDRSFRPVVVASAAALEGEARWAAELMGEVLMETDFSDTERLADLLAQKRVALEQGFASAGHSVAVQRAASYHSQAALVREAWGGVGFYRFLCGVLDGSGASLEELGAKLAELSSRLFPHAGMLLSYAGPEEALARYDAADALAGHGGAVPSRLLEVPQPVDLHEALAVPADVTYTAISSDRRLLAGQPPYSGAWLLASRVLSYDYLWNEVRVKGGAYGCGFTVARPGALSLYSFRDPAVDPTVQRFRKAGEWLSAFHPSTAEMEGFVVSSVASYDAPCKPRQLVRRQCGMHLSGVTPEMRAEVRAQMVSTSAADLRSLGGAVSEMAERGCLAAVGGPDLLERSKVGLQVVSLREQR